MSDKPARNRLSSAQRYRITKYLEENQPRITEERLNGAQVAAEVSEKLGLQVNRDNIMTIMGGSKECIIAHKWPMGTGDVPGREGHMNRRLAVLVQFVKCIAEQMDPKIQIPEHLDKMFEQLCQEAAVPEAPPEQPVEGDAPEEGSEPS